MLDKLKTLWGEPAALIGVLEGALAFALTLTSLDTNTQGVIMAAAVALGGLYGAWVTQTTMLGALVGVVKAGAVLAATLHYSFSATSQATLISALTVGLGLLYRTQTSPVVPHAAPAPLAAEQTYSVTDIGEPISVPAAAENVEAHCPVDPAHEARSAAAKKAAATRAANKAKGTGA